MPHDEISGGEKPSSNKSVNCNVMGGNVNGAKCSWGDIYRWKCHGESFYQTKGPGSETELIRKSQPIVFTVIF
jgi:hypothetical protein